MNENVKRCSSCKCVWERTTEYFSNDMSQPDGFNDRCKVCEYDRWSVYYYNNHARELERNRKKYDPVYFREYRKKKRDEQRAALSATA